MANGYVDVAVAKPDKNGKTRYSFKVKNDDKWYSCGLDNPQIKKGDKIEFDFDTNGDWHNVTPGSVKITQSGPEIVEAKKGFGGFARRGPSPGAAEKEKYWEDKAIRDVDTQKRIQLQASRNSAIEVADLMLRNGAIKLPDALAKRHDIIAALIFEWVDRFEKQVNERDVPVVAEIETTESTGDWE